MLAAVHAAGADLADRTADAGVHDDTIASSSPEPPMQTPRQGAPAPNDVVPRWLEAVRAQRRALQERRRAQHQARRRAIDPVGTARQEALEQAFQRRRQEMRDKIAQDRWLFLNFGPWLSPLPSPSVVTPRGAPPAAGSTPPEPQADGTDEPPKRAMELPDWDNGWYFNGW